MIFNFLSIVLLFFVDFELSIRIPVPNDDFSYMYGRNKLKQLDDSEKFTNKKERIVNLYFEREKNLEFEHTKKSFYPSRPIENVIENILKNPLYELLKSFPKGGNLHVHESQMLDRKLFLSLIFESAEYEFLYICDSLNEIICQEEKCDCPSYHLKYFTRDVPPGWVKVKDSNWSIEEILRKTTLISMLNEANSTYLPTDSHGRWDVALTSGLFTFYDDVFKHNQTRYKYMRACMEKSLRDNVQLVEFRRSEFGQLYYFDLAGNRVNISEHDEINVLQNLRQELKNEHESFIDFGFIVYAVRLHSKDYIREYLDRVIRLQKSYPNVIKGFDLVGEEDIGHTLLFYKDELLNGFQYARQSNETFNLVFHSIETNWPVDYLPPTSKDIVSNMNNIFDALLLRTKRIGHGLGLIKFPHLYSHLIEKQIAIEVSPTSNQILGIINV
jgi:adenosine deaminase-related growth factor